MKITVLFMQRKEDYEGEYGPEVCGAVDEFINDENPSFWIKEVERLKELHKKEAQAFAEVVIEVDQAEIRRRLVPPSPTVKGTVVRE